MATKEKPQVTRADADNVVRKLQDLRETLTPSEQLVLDNALQVFQDRVSQPEAQELLNQFPEASDLLDDVAGFAATYTAIPGDSQPIGPTITLTTTVTVAASHPWITCMQARVVE
jgi:hypothetical protein